MANEPITSLVELTAPHTDDLLYVVDMHDVSTVPVSKKLKITNLVSGLPAATTGVPGLMSAADKTTLAAATASGTASTLVLRDGAGATTIPTLTVSTAATINAATATTLTVGGGTSITKIIKGTYTANFGTINANSTKSVSMDPVVSGLVAGAPCCTSGLFFNSTGIVCHGFFIDSPTQVTLKMSNLTASPVVVGSMTFTFLAIMV